MNGSRMVGLVALGAVVLIAGRGLATPHHGGHGADGPTHGRGGGDAKGGAGPHGGGTPGGGPHGSGACDPVILAGIDAALASACPCAGTDDGAGGTTPWKNHGQYVRCVAHAVRDAARSAGLKRRCVHDLVPCAARSTCGKNGAVTCIIPLTGTCVGGTCSNDVEMPCGLDADCATTACAITSTDGCAASDGAAGTGSCCTASPSGAFLDAF